MAGSIAKAEELKKSIPGSVILQQFENPANTEVHARSTGEEIWQDTDGEVAVFVAGVGTGGTVCGVARALKKHNPNVYIVAVEPHPLRYSKAGKQLHTVYRGSERISCPAFTMLRLWTKSCLCPMMKRFVADENWPRQKDCWWEFLPEQLFMQPVNWPDVRNLKEK